VSALGVGLSRRIVVTRTAVIGATYPLARVIGEGPASTTLRNLRRSYGSTARSW